MTTTSIPGDSEQDESTEHPYVGRSVGRSEDRRLLRGEGRYIENIPIKDSLDVVFVRSPLAHATIDAVDVSAAASADGVVAVVTADQLGGCNGPVPVIWQLPGLNIPPYPALADSIVSYVGQPVVAVVATSRELAEDAAELVEIAYTERPVVANALAAVEPGSPLVHDQFGSNIAYESHVRSDGVDQLFASADTVVEGELQIHRHTAVPLQRRTLVARPDPTDMRLTVWATVQHPHLFRDHVAGVLGIPIDEIRIIAPDIGGAFGVYYDIYPEDLVVIWAARSLGRAVRFVEDRSEAFLSTVHARQQHHRASFALSADGKVLAVRADIVTDIGAFIDYSGVGPSYYTANYLTGPYEIPAVDIRLRCAFTNKVRSGGYRGFGQPQATFVLERMMDLSAARLQMDPAEIRRVNVIPPEKFPYRIPTGPVMDSGDYPGVLDSLLESADYVELRRSQEFARQQGRLVGIGMAMYTEATAPGPSRGMATRGYMTGGWESATIRVAQDGRITVYSGASHIGQGIRTALSQVCADHLGVTPDDVTVVTGDTDLVLAGNRGSIGSRSMVVAGQAVNQASADLVDLIKDIAAEMLEADAADLHVSGGLVGVNGVPSQSLTLAEVSTAAAHRHRIDPTRPPILQTVASYEPPPGIGPFGSGAHLAMVEVDPGTGHVEILKYLVVHDCGTVVNPALVEGQIRGGSAQGIGAALLEELVYDDDGQLRTGTMMDYSLPTAMEIPDIEIRHQETPCPFHPLGVKGCGEAGTVGPTAALANAVSDALGSPMNVLPLTPERLWLAAQAETVEAR
jgi:carbon-monoxide dehydrogenase large subunit